MPYPSIMVMHTIELINKMSYINMLFCKQFQVKVPLEQKSLGNGCRLLSFDIFYDYYC